MTKKYNYNLNPDNVELNEIYSAIGKLPTTVKIRATRKLLAEPYNFTMEQIGDVLGVSKQAVSEYNKRV